MQKFPAEPMNEDQLIQMLDIVLTIGCHMMDVRRPDGSRAAIVIAQQMLVAAADLKIEAIDIEDEDLGVGPDDYGKEGIYVCDGKFLLIPSLNEREIISVVTTFINRAAEALEKEMGFRSSSNLRMAQKTIELYLHDRG